jgi:hypothetical protein
VTGVLSIHELEPLTLDKAAEATPLGLRLRPGVPFDTWTTIGRQVAVVGNATAWWLGDWLAYGQAAYGGRYRAAVEATGLDYQTLRNYASVARRFPLSRRRDKLSFQHHAEVAALPERDQDEWLDAALEEGWSRNELRRRVHADVPAPQQRGGGPASVQLIVLPARAERWRAAAARHGRTLEDWISLVLDEAAGSVAVEPAAEEASAHERSGTRYSEWQKQQVKLLYPACRSTRDKHDLAARLRIVDDEGEPSVARLYHLASRLGCTRGRDQHEREAAINSADRLRTRTDPEQLVFTAEDDRHLRENFGRRRPEAIAFDLGQPETATLYRARKLGLRRPVKHWPAHKAAAWLGLTLEELLAERERGVDVYSLGGDRSASAALHVVSTTSLWRWLGRPEKQRLLAEREVDRFFLLELEESKEAILADPDAWESCQHLSHGHVCQNPRADGFDLFCPDNGRYRAGEDPKCTVRGLDVSALGRVAR